MATKTGKYVKEQTNEVTITMTVELTSILKLPTNDPDKAQKAIEAEKRRLMRAYTKIGGVDNVNVTKQKIFENLAE